MNPKIDHIHITVKDINRAKKFYDKLLPIIGFDLSLKEYANVPEHEYKIIEYHNKNFSFGIVNECLQHAHESVNQRKPRALHHLAFHVETKEEVDILYQKILEIPTAIVQPTQYYIEYCKDYYAVFFKDSEGIEYEIVNFQRNKYFIK